MTQTNIDAPPSRIEKFKIFARSRDGWTLLLAIAIAVVSSIFMAGLLPVKTSFAARRLHLGYRKLRLLQDGPLGAAGSFLRGQLLRPKSSAVGR